MKIAFLSSEVVPYAKTGGLADVAGALPKVLAGLGPEIRLFMPFYRAVRAKNLKLDKVLDATLAWAGEKWPFTILEHRAEGFLVDFIVCEPYYDRDGLYGTPSGDYPDNGLRFAFFARAALEAMKALRFAPDILHGHDWQAATAFAYLKFVYGGEAFFGRTRSLFTIHNLAYQGLFGRDTLASIGLPDRLFNMNDLEFFGKVNYLKAGILYADAVSTVSPRYSREIQTEEFGNGLDGLLRSRADVLSGILNGVDYTDWNPVTDRLIPAHFSPADLSGKSRCRSTLLDEFGLSCEPRVPVAGMVTRLASQKGLDIVCDALEGIFGLGIALVILGTGDEKIQDFLKASRVRYPDQLGLRVAFDEKVAHMIYAGSDLFLIPSRYEPCGLTQMYALKYGTIPVVRATGGLDDTIREFDPETGTGNGFKFSEPEPAPMLEALARALKAHARRDLWQGLAKRAMAADFSWDKSAAEYLRLYEKILAAPRA